ncbi:MAG: YggT family protein [Chloroflexi bacterium HGW-Chloroflexi-3]|nr:MAG: YggT family protein [Chloroflexi bacterium HGW-Chloroflexi-3]
MFDFLIVLVRIAANIFSLLVIAKVLLSYFLSPYHPIRQIIDQLIEPLLAPIRNRMPMVGMLDFSPIVLLIGIQILEFLLVTIIASL